MEQTNRTILFEELNPDKANLFTVLETAKEQESLTDEEICEIEKLFVVHSFEEVIEKFEPTVYLTGTILDGVYSFSYESRNLTGGVSIPIRLDLQNRMLTLFLEMLDYKVTGEIPSQKLEKLAGYIFPQHDFERIVELRRVLKAAFLENRFQEAERLLHENADIISNPLLQVQFFIHEAQTLLQKETLKEDFIRLEDTPEMQISVLCRSAKFEKADPCLPAESVNGFVEWIEGYLSKCQIRESELVKQNLMSVTEAVKADVTYYMELYRKTLDVYADVVRDYWKVLQPLLQTVLGIRSFFAQCGERQGQMKPSLVITNCNADQIMDARRLKLLETFLETVNQKNTHQYTIWYAILPGIENPMAVDRKNVRERFLGNGDSAVLKSIDVDTAKTLMSVLTKYKIQIFMSTAATQDNTFTAFAKEGMGGFYESFRPFERESYTTYLIPCYPNFRLMLKEQAKASIGMQIELDESDEERFYSTKIKNVWLTELYIDASYVAAGLVAAYQCTGYLGSLYNRMVDEELPGVAYRILEGDNRYRSKTVMAKEVYGYHDELTQQIIRYGNGIIFASEKTGVTVLSDKTMALQSGNKISIAQMQTVTYLERVIRAMTQDYKDTLIKKFFVNRQDNMMHKWMQNRTMINSLFREGESIQYQINEQEGTCNFEVRFADSIVESRVKLSR